MLVFLTIGDIFKILFWIQNLLRSIETPVRVRRYLWRCHERFYFIRTREKYHCDGRRIESPTPWSHTNDRELLEGSASPRLPVTTPAYTPSGENLPKSNISRDTRRKGFGLGLKPPAFIFVILLF